MLAKPPVYDDRGKLVIDSVELKVVDFGIFGSIAGIQQEDIHCGSLRYMAPELLSGNTASSPAIDIWSLGLLLHAMVVGWFPFHKNNIDELKKQILTEELDYKRLKRLRNSSIKDEYRKELNLRLRNVSDECIDLIQKMLCKDPNNRIEMIDILDHPWI